MVTIPLLVTFALVSYSLSLWISAAFGSPALSLADWLNMSATGAQNVECCSHVWQMVSVSVRVTAVPVSTKYVADSAVHALRGMSLHCCSEIPSNTQLKSSVRNCNAVGVQSRVYPQLRVFTCH